MPRVRKRSGSWQALWRLLDGREKSETRRGWTKAEALAYAHHKEDETSRTPWVGRTERVPTFQGYSTEHIATRAIAPSSQYKERAMWRRINAAMGSMPLNAISPSDVRSVVNRFQKDGLSAAYVRDLYGLIRLTFEYAVADAHVGQTPCVAIRLPKRTTRVQPANPEAVRRLIRIIAARYRALVAFIAATGTRIGEALAMQVKDLHDVPRFGESITKTVTTDASGSPIVSSPKSPTSVRNVALAHWLRPVLSRHISELGLSGDDWLFPSPKGRLMNPRNFRRRFWNPAVDAAGAPGLTPHQLRHLHVSMLFEAGRPVTEVAARMGHASSQVTGAVYAHWLREDDSGAADIVPDFTVDLFRPLAQSD